MGGVVEGARSTFILREDRESYLIILLGGTGFDRQIMHLSKHEWWRRGGCGIICLEQASRALSQAHLADRSVQDEGMDPWHIP